MIRRIPTCFYLVILSFFSVVIGCGPRNESKTSTITVVNELADEITLGVGGNTARGELTYGVPAGATRRFLHGYNISSTYTTSESQILLTITSNTGVEIGRFLAISRHDDSSGDRGTTSFADGRQGISVLDVQCLDNKCTINGTEMNQAATLASPR